MKTAAAIGILATTLALAGAAWAEDRHFSYDPDNDEAKHRTQSIDLWVHEGLMGALRVTHLYRNRGDGFELRAVNPPWSPKALDTALQGDPHGIAFYEIDPKDGEGFARGACHGAAKAWLAMAQLKPYQPLRIVVLGDDPANHAPVVCELLDYRWRGEWILPPKKNDSRAEEHGGERKF